MRKAETGIIVRLNEKIRDRIIVRLNEKIRDRIIVRLNEKIRDGKIVRLSERSERNGPRAPEAELGWRNSGDKHLHKSKLF